MKRFVIIAAAMFAMLPYGCKKKGTASPVPSITFVGMNTQEVRSGSIEDTIYVQLGLVDGDADLKGSFMYVIDNRDSSETSLGFPDFEGVTLPENEIAQGNIYVQLPAAFMLARTDTAHIERDTVIYKMYMRDGSGNKSNEVELLPIYLNQ